MSTKATKNVCCLLNAPSIDNDALKREIESFLSRPDSVVRVDSKVLGKVGRVCVEFRKSNDRDAFYAIRRNFRIEGKPVVITCGKQVIGESQTLVDDIVSKEAKRNLHEKPIISPLFDLASLIPSMDNFEWPKTIVAADSFSSLITFNAQLRRVLFDQDHEGTEEDVQSYDCNDQSSDQGPSVQRKYAVSPDMMLESIHRPHKLSSPDDVVSIPLDPNHTATFECCDILSERADVIVLQTKTDLVPVGSYDLDGRLREAAGESYVSERTDFIKKKGPPKQAACVVLKASNLIRCRVVHAATITESLEGFDMQLLEQTINNAYLHSLMEATKSGTNSISFLIFSEGVPISMSGRAACRMTNETLDLMKLPKEIRFVHPDIHVVQEFVEAFEKQFRHPGSDGAAHHKKVSTKPSFGRKTKSDYADDDIGKLSTAIGTFRTKEDQRTAAEDAAVKAVAQLMETEVQGGETKPPSSDVSNRPYGKRSQEEKIRKKSTTTNERSKFYFERTKQLMTEVTLNWPDQLKCAICNKVFAESSTSENAETELSLERSQRCHRLFHFNCIDEAGGVCGFCIGIVRMGSDGRCEDQPTNGKMEVKIVNEPTPAGFPDANGHILVTYVFPCGVQGPKGPKPGEFYYGCARMAYLPNNEQGKAICDGLEAAFNRGLVMTIGRLTNGYGDCGVCWGSIPHKTSLTGGRSKWGYPDDTYLSRIDKLLTSLGVKGADLPTDM